MEPKNACQRVIQIALALLGGASLVFAADPVPYDSIANPLSKLPQTDATVQRQGDLLNMKPSRVRVNQAGYRTVDVAAGLGKFYYVGPGLTFKLIDDSGKDVPTGTGVLVSKGATVSGQIIANAANSAEHMAGGYGDWKPGYPMTGTVVSGPLMQGVIPTGIPGGRYRIVVGASDTSMRFIVSDNVYGMARDAAIKFFGVARSGEYESWFHPASHMWDGWLYDSAAKNPDGSYKYKGALTGGWYDCGNHLKEAVTNAYPLAAIGMMAATNPEKDVDHYALNQGLTLRTDGIPDVLREAWVGAQFVLKSFRLAKGVADDMYLSVGDPTKQFDFQWWGRPENQDAVLSVNRGGRRERGVLKNSGSESMSNFAAGMAYLGRLYRPYDPKFADTAVMIAQAMYEFAKKANKKESATDYGSGGSQTHASLAHAAVALLWATRDTKYLNELAYAPSMPDGRGGVCGASGWNIDPSFYFTRFNGGFFGCGTNSIARQWATDYQNTNGLVLYSFIKLILVDPDTAKNYGITTKAQRDTLLLRSLNNLLGSNIGGAGKRFNLPTANNQAIGYDSLWYNSTVSGGGWFNKYQFGNLADLYMYYDATSLVEGKALLSMDGSTDWKRKEVLEVLVGGLGYMLGVNPLDLSYIFGIGTKNPNHPHHRGSNPEGKNVPGAYYNYAIPVGGLYGGMTPANTMKMTEYFDKPVEQTEAICPDAAAVELIPLMGLARAEVPQAPRPTVKVLYTTDTSAVIQVDLDKWGFVKINYGLDSSIATQTNSVNGNDTSNSIRVTLPKLTPATVYYFYVTTSDLYGNTLVASKWPNGKNDSIPFTFITKAKPQTAPLFGNIKVCNVTSDSAEIMWITPNGQFQSSVLFADSANWKVAKYTEVDTDAVGDIPVTFHRVKLTGLKPKTTYYFKVGVPGSYDATVGCFRTPNEDVKFDVRASGYIWSGMRALTIGITNQDVKSYDSLQIRLYVTGTAANVWDLGARCDIGIKYRTDGFQDAGFAFVVDQNLRKSHPRKIDSTCTDAQVCQWYFDVPIWGAIMESQARMRLDLVWDKHKIELSQPPNPVPVLFDDLMNLPPSHDVFDATNGDWSFRPHVAGTDNGLSPVDYAGVPYVNDASTKNIMDEAPQTVEINPYIAVYRRNEFIYGFSPYAAEQATKRVVYAMNMKFNQPFDVANGNTIQIGNATSTRLTGIADVYDQLTPGAKGYITSIWVNGVALPDAQRRKSAIRQADGTWKIDVPLKFTLGTNKLDVTFFASSDSLDTTSVTDACTEGKGCAFYNGEWYVNYASNLTPSVLSVLDASGIPADRVSPDSSVLTVRLNDGNANANKTTADVVSVKVFNKMLGTTQTITLQETGVNTGIFQSIFSVVAKAPLAGQIQVRHGDSAFFHYLDAQDETDSSDAAIYSKALWPTPMRAGLFRDCGGSNSVRVLYDRAFAASGWDSARVVLRNGADSLVNRIGPASIGSDASGATLILTIPSLFAGDLTGRLDLDVSNGQGGWVKTSVAIADSIGPWIDSTKIVENLTGNPFDTLYLWTSEPTKSLGSTLPILLSRNGTSVPTTGLVVKDPPYADASGRWTYVITAGIVKPQDSLRWNPALVADTKGNLALDCPSLARVLRLVSRPAPFARAWLKDADGDGRADQISMVFLKQLVASDLPDSIRVAFGAANTVRSSAVNLSMVTGSVLTVPLLDPYATTHTRGSSADGSGKLDLWKSGEASGPYGLIDSVGPNLLSAKLRFGAVGSATDTLELEFSEPVRKSSGSGWLVLNPGSELGTVGVPDSLSPTVWKLPVDTATVVSGDLVRPVPTGKWGDVSGGNKVGVSHAWIPVQGGERGPIGGWYEDTNGDGAVDLATIQFFKSPKTRSAMNLLWPSHTGFDSTRIDSGAWTLGADGLTASIAVGPFAKGVTSSQVIKLGRWISGGVTSTFPMADKVAAVLVSAMVRYASADGLSDTLRLRWSERLNWATGPLVFHDNTSKGLPSENVTYRSGELDPDGLGAWLLIDSTTTVLQRGDSARLAPSVGDALGNLAGAFTVRVPVTFGLRPPRLDFKLYNFVDYDGIWPLGTGESFQTWVRQRGDAWQTIRGTAPADVDESHFLGMELTLNQFLDGYAYIYDNTGAFVAKADFGSIRKMVEEGRFQADGSGTYQIRLAWDGRSIAGSPVSSGVYYMRLVLKFQLDGAIKPYLVNRVYTLGYKRATK